jgi:uncharacterized membrane protein
MALDFLVDNETVWRYLHILSGITWIGLLYFFNFVNAPLFKFQIKKPYEANMAEKATGPVVLKTLFFFRWGAASTLLWGLILLYVEGSAHGGMGNYLLHNGMQGYAITMGVFFALVMFFNVWAVIWPRQQKILANNKAAAASADEAEKKRLADANAPMVKEATMASRANTWLSVPMLWGMVFGAHGYYGGTTLRSWLFPVTVLVVVLLLMWMYSQEPKKKDAPAAAPAAPKP